MVQWGLAPIFHSGELIMSKLTFNWDLINTIKSELKLANEVRINFRETSHPEYRALCETTYNSRGKIKLHKITIWLGDIAADPIRNDINSVIAHELIHAKLFESQLDDPDCWHNLAFQLMAKMMEQKWPELHNIYRAELDTD